MLITHSGDFNTGTPESDLLNAAPDIAAFNAMGLDVSAVGNHEFDKDFSVLRKQIRQARYPLVMANIKAKNPDDFYISPYVIKRKANKNICIIGVTTNKIKGIMLKSKENKIVLLDTVEAVKEQIKNFPKQSLVLVLSHIGVDDSRHEGAGNIFDDELAAKVSGISVIIGGHSHSTLYKPKKINDTLILQAGCYGEKIGRLDLEIADNNKIVNYKYKIIDINSKDKSPKIAALIDKYTGKYAHHLNKVLGKNRSLLDFAKIRKEETAIGNLIADIVKVKGCDIGMYQSGGVRASLKTGNLTVRDILTTLPFNSVIVKIRLHGSDLKSILDESVAKKSFLLISGMNIRIKEDNVVINDIQGQKIDANKQYTLCTSDYLVEGGDGFKTLFAFKGYKENTRIFVHDSLMDYVKKNKIIEYKVDGRILLQDKKLK